MATVSPSRGGGGGGGGGGRRVPPRPAAGCFERRVAPCLDRILCVGMYSILPFLAAVIVIMSTSLVSSDWERFWGRHIWIHFVPPAEMLAGGPPGGAGDLLGQVLFSDGPRRRHPSSTADALPTDPTAAANALLHRALLRGQHPDALGFEQIWVRPDGDRLHVWIKEYYASHTEVWDLSARAPQAPVSRSPDDDKMGQPRGDGWTIWFSSSGSRGSSSSGSSPAADNNNNDGLQVHWSVPVGCDWSGFFVEGLEFAKGLRPLLGSSGLSSSSSPSWFHLDVGPCDDAMLSAMSPAERAILSSPAPTATPRVAIVHKLPGSDYALPFIRTDGDVSNQPRVLTVGRQMTEAAKLSLSEARQAQRMDQVWVPTEFHRGVFEKAGVDQDKIVVMPEPVDTSFFRPAASSTSDAAWRVDGVTRFVSVFKFEKRKGWDVLLDTYWTAFPEADDPVELVLRTYRPSWEPGDKDIDRVIERHAQEYLRAQGIGGDGAARDRLARVVWEPRALTRVELRDLYRRSDAFVLPTRGEGWCLPAVEAMATGLPVIVTNFSGPTAFLGGGSGGAEEQRAYPVGIATQLNRDGTAEPVATDVEDALRRVAVRPDEAVAVGRAARRWVVKHLDTQVVAAAAAAALRRGIAQLRGSGDAHNEL